MRLEYTARARDDGRRVYHILKNELRLSAELIKRLKRESAVTVDGTPVYLDRRLVPGETVAAELSRAETPPEFPPERGSVEVLFENEGLLALNKPAGMLTHPSRGKFTGTLANYAAGYLADTGSSPALHPVNRLDRDTSGVVLFAKNAHVMNLAVSALKSPEAEKAYIAYLFGRLPEKAGEIKAPIAREREGFQKRVVREDGKPAVTRWRVLREAEILGYRVSEVRLTLLTGRTHQIRVHCSYLGAPVLGDRLYGRDEPPELSERLGLEAHLLHAVSLTLREPMTGELVTAKAPVRREDMLRVSELFG